MIINDQQKYIFIHIPKNAGCSIASILTQKHSNIYKTHTTANILQKSLSNYNDYYSFAFVRNPWDRLFSLYNFLCQKKMNVGVGEDWCQIEYKAKGFKWWLMHNEWYPPFDRTSNSIPHQKKCQLDWLVNEQNDIIVNHIGKFENISESIITLQRKLNIKHTIPKINSTKHGEYRLAYDDEMVEFVNVYHEKDIKKFDYRF